jgi:hypothetical protein
MLTQEGISLVAETKEIADAYIELGDRVTFLSQFA